MKLIWSIVFVAIAWGGAGNAKTPRVVADIAPIYSIAARIMVGVGEPTLIVEQSSSPHDFALRPSHARALQNADVVFAVSKDLTPWLVDSLQTLSKDAEVVFLDGIEAAQLLEARGGDEHGHDHSDIDPHSWLNPENAALWGTEIAQRLKQIDPENADIYMANATNFVDEMAVVSKAVEVTLSDVAERNYLVYHDAFQYFETRFSVPSVGFISNSEATSPGPRKLQEAKELISSANAQCLVAEPGYKEGVLAAVAPEGGLKMAELDGLGSRLPLDENLYAKVLTNMASALAACLKP